MCIYADFVRSVFLLPETLGYISELNEHSYAYVKEDQVCVENSINWHFDMLSVNHDIVINFVDVIKSLTFSYPEKGGKIFLTHLKRFLLDNAA
jgi:hypothetical protein